MHNGRTVVLALLAAGSLQSVPAAVAQTHYWGAYTGYHFDRFQGDEGYGVAWNFPDPTKALREALRVCRQHQPTPPTGEGFDETWRYHSGERCGDVAFAFSSGGPSPETVTTTPDQAWANGFKKLTVLRRHRCISVIELSNHPDGFDRLGSNFHMHRGDSEAELAALTERLYAGEDRKPNEAYPNPYRVAVIACNDR